MVRQKWTNEKISEIREARSTGLKLKELETKFSLSRNQVNYAVYKYQMKEPLEKSKKRDWIADAYDAKEKDKKEGKKKSFFEWLLG